MDLNALLGLTAHGVCGTDESGKIYSLALAGSLGQARAWAATLRRAHPGYGIADFLSAFRFDANGAALFRRGAKRVGMA